MSPFRPATATNPKPSAASSGLAPAGREPRKTPVAVPIPTAPLSSPPDTTSAHRRRDWRLHKHADYQRVYQSSRKQFSTSMTYFAAPQPAAHGPRIGITAGKVLGKATERSRIKRRMRAAIVASLDALNANVDVVLHPKRSVLTAEWSALRNEVRRIFVKIQENNSRNLPQPHAPADRRTQEDRK